MYILDKNFEMQYEEKEKTRKTEDFKSNKIYKEMDTVSGYWDKSSKKWIRIYDQYKYPENEDNECKGMTLNQFLHKCKDQKKHVIELTSSSSSSIQQNINQKFEDSRSSPNGKRKRKKNIENFQPKSKKSRKMILDVSDSELQRINRVRRFASRLFKKERKMYNMSPTISKDTKSEHTVFPLKKVIKKESNDRIEDCKKQRLDERRKKPVIKSIKIVNYNINKHNEQL